MFYKNISINYRWDNHHRFLDWDSFARSKTLICDDVTDKEFNDFLKSLTACSHEYICFLSYDNEPPLICSREYVFNNFWALLVASGDAHLFGAEKENGNYKFHLNDFAQIYAGRWFSVFKSTRTDSE